MSTSQTPTGDVMSHEQYETIDEVPFDEGDTIIIGEDTEAEVLGIKLFSNRVSIKSKCAHGPRQRACREVLIEQCEPVA
jgi:hypothetical protein